MTDIRPTPSVVEDEELVELLILKARVFERSVGGPVDEMEKAQQELIGVRAALAASDRDVLVAENERLREALLAFDGCKVEGIKQDGCLVLQVPFAVLDKIDAALVPLGGGV